MAVLFETKDYLVRPFKDTDAQGIFELDTCPEVMKFLGGVSITTLEEAQKLVDNLIWQYQEFKTARLAIINRATKEFIGWTGIKYERGLRDFPYYDIGYRLKYNYWGKGIATEPARFALHHGFTTLGLNELHAAADMNNAASQRVLLKVGMQPDGTFYYLNEEHLWYSITKDQWKIYSSNR